MDKWEESDARLNFLVDEPKFELVEYMPAIMPMQYGIMLCSCS
jgi:hypothetical protein